MSVKAYQTPDGKTLYKVYVNVASRRNRKKRIQKYKEGIKTEKEARNIAKKFSDEAKREMGKLDGYGLLWSDILINFQNSIPQGFSTFIEDTAIDYLSCAKTWTQPWMMMVAKEITSIDARDVFDRMDDEEKEPSYQDKVKKAIKAIYTWAINKGFIIDGKNPMDGIKIKKGKSKPPLVLSYKEYDFLLKKAQERNIEWYPVWHTALHTGMRSGELKAFKVSDIDWERNCIKLARSISSKTKKEKSTKTEDWRMVPLSKSLRKILEDLCKDKGANDFVLPRISDWNNNKQSQYLRSFCEGIGIKSVNFHALRATWATQMLDRGVSQAKIMEIGGWADVRTFNIYVRLAAVNVAGATDCLDDPSVLNQKPLLPEMPIP